MKIISLIMCTQFCITAGHRSLTNVNDDTEIEGSMNYFSRVCGRSRAGEKHNLSMIFRVLRLAY